MAMPNRNRAFIGKYLILHCYIIKKEITSFDNCPIIVDVGIMDTDTGSKYNKSFTTLKAIDDSNIEEFLKTCNLEENE